MFETLVMADRISNYATVSGVIVGLGVLLFAVRTHRKKEDKESKIWFQRQAHFRLIYVTRGNSK